MASNTGGRTIKPLKIYKQRLIRGIKWEIIITSDIIDDIKEEGTDGLTCPNQRIIKIKEGLSRDITLEVLWHEEFHAYCFECHVDFKSINSEEVDEYTANVAGGFVLDGMPYWMKLLK